MENNDNLKNEQKKVKAGKFDPSALSLGQDFASTVGVKQVLTHIATRKPDGQSFFMAHPDPKMRIVAAALEDNESKETYIVTPDIAAQISNEVSIRTFITCITLQKVLFLWPLKHDTGEGSRRNLWNSSAMAAADLALEKWVRVKSNMATQSYEVFEALGLRDEPEWPSLSLEEILALAFKDRIIDDINHPLLKKLRGEI